MTPAPAHTLTRDPATGNSPSTELTVGVAKERVDPNTLLIFEQIFPGQHGITFLIGILRLALAKQLALPGLDISSATDVAVITVQSLRALAELIGLSYDTTEKYVVVLCQLRLLYKERYRRQIVLYFPLCPVRLPEPEVLDTLNEYRPKVVSFARQVKRRFVLLCKRSKITEPTSHPVTTQEVQRLPQLLVEDISRLVHGEVDSETANRLMLKIEGVVQYRCATPGNLLSEENGTSSEENRNVGDISEVTESSDLTQTVGSDIVASGRASIQSLPLSETGDSDIHTSNEESRFLGTKGDFGENTSLTQKSSVPIRRVDSDSQTEAQNGRLSQKVPKESTESSDIPTKVAKKGGEEVLNVNVIVLQKQLEFLNVNVGAVGAYLCQIFGENPKKKGYYKNLRDTQGCNNVDAWLAAAIETIIAIERHRSDVVTNPGGYFFKRCLDLHRDGIPTPTQRLMQQYGPLTHPQILSALRQEPLARPTHSTQASSQTSRKGNTCNKVKLTIDRLPKERHGMTLVEYQELAKRIRDGQNTELMRIAAPYQQNDGSCVALVEDFLETQRWICSLEEWPQTIERSIWPDK